MSFNRQSKSLHCRNEHLWPHRQLKWKSSKTAVVLQWILSHCGITGNEEAEDLSKSGSKMKQFSHKWPTERLNLNQQQNYVSPSGREAGVRNNCSLPSLTSCRKWCWHHPSHPEAPADSHLQTKDCTLLSQLNQLKIAHTDECPMAVDTRPKNTFSSTVQIINLYVTEPGPRVSSRIVTRTAMGKPSRPGEDRVLHPGKWAAFRRKSLIKNLLLLLLLLIIGDKIQM